MNCMKCGRKIENSGVFCEDCLSIMDKYPVKQNTPLQLSKQKIEAEIRRPSKKKHQTAPDEQVRLLRRMMRRLRMLVVALLIMLTLLTASLAYVVFLQPEGNDLDLGKNYTTSEPGGE